MQIAARRHAVLGLLAFAGALLPVTASGQRGSQLAALRARPGTPGPSQAPLGRGAVLLQDVAAASRGAGCVDASGAEARCANATAAGAGGAPRPPRFSQDFVPSASAAQGLATTVAHNTGVNLPGVPHTPLDTSFHDLTEASSAGLTTVGVASSAAITSQAMAEGAVEYVEDSSRDIHDLHRMLRSASQAASDSLRGMNPLTPPPPPTLSPRWLPTVPPHAQAPAPASAPH